MPKPSTYYLAESESVGPQGRIIGGVWWRSKSTGKAHKSGGNQDRRANALYERSLKDGFRCRVCWADLPLSSRAVRTHCSNACRTKLRDMRRTGVPGTEKTRNYPPTRKPTKDQKQVTLRRQMGLTPYPPHHKPGVL